MLNPSRMEQTNGSHTQLPIHWWHHFPITTNRWQEWRPLHAAHPQHPRWYTLLSSPWWWNLPWTASCFPRVYGAATEPGIATQSREYWRAFLHIWNPPRKWFPPCVEQACPSLQREIPSSYQWDPVKIQLGLFHPHYATISVEDINALKWEKPCSYERTWCQQPYRKLAEIKPFILTKPRLHQHSKSPHQCPTNQGIPEGCKRIKPGRRYPRRKPDNLWIILDNNCIWLTEL